MNDLLDRLKDDLANALPGKLTGAYVHGSLAMGCHHPVFSDVDLVATVREPLTHEDRLRLGSRLVRTRTEYPSGGGIELSVVLDRAIEALGCPTPVEFHYSEFHHARYAADAGYVVAGYEDADLAGQLAVARERGFALVGEPLCRRMPPVGRETMLASVLQDVAEAADRIAEQPVYYVLNLCRTLLYVREGVILSKREGGERAAAMLPAAWRPLVRQALEAYNGGAQPAWDGRLLASFAGRMLIEIRAEAASGNAGKERL